MPETPLAHVAGWLRCPVCGSAGLAVDARQLRCSHGHAFDIARQGYVNLLGRSQPRNADTTPMVTARDRFLQQGWYRPLEAAIAGAMEGARRVAEAGAGTGRYLATGLGPDAWGLATDVSVPACRRAARISPRIAAVVADTWAGLPLVSDSIDALLCVFAPRNAQEFLRVLAPGGRLVVVTPEPGHLEELRRANGLLDIGQGKTERLRADLGELSLLGDEVIEFPLDLDDTAAHDLVGMGPNAFHHAEAVTVVPTRAVVRLSVFAATRPES